MRRLVIIIIAIGVAIPLFVLIRMMLQPVDINVSNILKAALKDDAPTYVESKGYNIVIDSTNTIFINDVKTDIKRLSFCIDSIDKQGKVDTIISLDLDKNVPMKYVVEIMNIAKEKKKKLVLKP
ncbi:MAG: biopolymer transporter ExbD [Bacteroidales bacterium]|jgi:biopolymer transport protein ExbD|nr:biopolymer transporter ExbD [Bacteroidales bacterium]